MNPGQLKHKIVIEQSTPAQDSFGEPIDSWTTFATRRASAKTLRGGESFKSSQVTSEAQVMFTLRFLDNVTTKMRVNWNARYFNILFVDNGDETQKETRLECKEFT